MKELDRIYFLNYKSSICNVPLSERIHIPLFFFVFIFTGERLAGALVRLGNENTEGEAPTNPVCGEIGVHQEGDGIDVYELDCRNTEGRYLSVNLPGKNYLTLCEVQIYAGECGKV